MIIQKDSNPCPITQITAFSGRKFCLETVIKSIEENCDSDLTHHIWLDNSRDNWFQKALAAYLSTKPNYTLFIDNSPFFDINQYQASSEAEKTEALVKIAYKVTNLYSNCFQFIRESSEVTWIVEDDVEVPQDSLSKLYENLSPEVGTVIGRMLDRRPHEQGAQVTVVYDYDVNMQLGSQNNYKVGIKPVVTGSIVPKYGVQLVGTGHMGCWLTKTGLIRELGLSVIEDGCLGCDNNWGWRLYKHNKQRVAVDWNVHCKHHYIDSYGNIKVAE